jgi:hypothetical protein
MSILDNVAEVLHEIRAKLYHNYLLNAEGKYIARAQVQKTLSVEEVCAAAVSRGGVTIPYADLVEAVYAYLKEMAYDLANGFGVGNPYYAIHPKITGTFADALSGIDPEKNKPDFTFCKRKGLRDLTDRITIVIDGVAETEAYIAEVIDFMSGLKNDTLTSGGVMSILGYKLKIMGTDPSIGVYLINQTDSTKTKITTNFIDNLPSKLTVMLPQLSSGTWRVQVITQYSGSTLPLKEARIIDYPIDLTVL